MHKDLDKWANGAPFLRRCHPAARKPFSTLNVTFFMEGVSDGAETLLRCESASDRKMAGACMSLDPSDLASELISCSAAHAPQLLRSAGRCSR